MQSQLTAKEVEMISDLLTLEESVCKKARIYSATLTNHAISQKLKSVAEKHEKRFRSLLSALQ